MSIVSRSATPESDSETGFDIEHLPVSFKKFLDENTIDPRIYTVTALPRYVRWNTHLGQTHLPTLEQLRQQLNTEQVWQVPGLDGFFGFHRSKQSPRLVDIPAYQHHALFGIDLSSAIAVEALEVQPNDHVLDVCCAPGAKLCMISNVLGDQGTGTVTGVDVASHRLATCRSLLKKYKVGGRARLFVADGTQFSVPAPSRLGNVVLEETEEQSKEGPSIKRRKMDRKKSEMTPFWAPKMLRFDHACSSRLYDKVGRWLLLVNGVD
ncbi:S-adenosyl-L-methionine-dependent methyltransferase [Spinellus fusiger]|nr:S-adenosyl-L-methionine-dependent methyltransferase [Spinellus fusiger]